MAKIRAINSKLDLRDTNGEVLQPITSTSITGNVSSVESQELFGKVESSPKATYENTAIYNNRAYIHLSIPVLNFFLAGEDASQLTKILKKDIKAIAEGAVMYVKSEGREISIQNNDTDIVYSDDILIGGEYIQFLIENLDVEKEIMDTVESICTSGLKELGFVDKNTSMSDVGVITRNGGIVHVVDKYYFNPMIEEIDAAELEEVFHSIVGDIFAKYNNRLLLLLSIRDDKSRIYDQVMNDVVVLPIGYRPPYQHKKDAMTHAYNSLVRVNNELGNAIMRYNTSIQTIRACYFDLIIAVKNVMIKNANRYNKQHKAITEMLKGKKGHIREKMQSSRFDYSGRSVIIVDPNMSVDTIGIPESMAVKLAELGILKEYQTKASNKANIFTEDNKYLRKTLARKIMEGSYASTGRQPTLYQLGLRGAKIVIVEGNAIVLNPLITPAFNADFDGDQMHVEVPLSPEAMEEVKVLMSIVNNLFLPRNGECHIAPRQEIIYGLWKAQICKEGRLPKKAISIDGTSESYSNLLEDVCNQVVNVYDDVTVNGYTENAGTVAIRACLGSTFNKYALGASPLTTDKSKEKPVKESYFKELFKEIILKDKSKFVDIVNKLVKLGFAVSNIFPPSIPVLNYPNVEHLIREFDERVHAREEYYNMGFETEAAFTLFYDSAYSDLEKAIKEELKAKLGSNNGYVDMMESGARGSISNIMQLFGMKGRVMKNENEAFNAIMKHPLASQLSGLEHFVTAYGARQGLVDKSIATYEPGYLSRQMSHSASGISITEEDCGTEDGVLLDFNFIKQFIPPQSLTGTDLLDNAPISKFLTRMLLGRYVVGYDFEIKTLREAKSVYKDKVAEVKDGKLIIKQGLKLRSPMTCKNPCCAKCYGTDLGTNMSAVPGLPVGFIASQSIGEPGTQLIMKNFQSGGVAGVSNLTSSFDVMDEYTHLYDLKKDGERPITYDYIAPVEGFVETVSRGDGTKTLKIKNMNKDGKMVNRLLAKVILYEDVKLKEYVKVGDTVRVIQGDLNIREILKYRSAEYAQKYLATKMYDIFQKEAYVDFKHFEVLVSSMCFMVCIKGNDEYFGSGKYYTLQEYHSHKHDDCIFYMTIKGIKDVPLYRNDVFSTIFMEDIQKGISHSIITSGIDEMKLPIVRYSFGLNIGMGTDVPGFLQSRGKV